jgi:hypothetical protein
MSKMKTRLPVSRVFLIVRSLTGGNWTFGQPVFTGEIQA